MGASGKVSLEEELCVAAGGLSAGMLGRARVVGSVGGGQEVVPLCKAEQAVQTASHTKAHRCEPSESPSQ